MGAYRERAYLSGGGFCAIVLFLPPHAAVSLFFFGWDSVTIRADER
jgi:hypothetical protein